jgi:diguanylate cyclase (GGDEF)-like protein
VSQTKPRMARHLPWVDRLKGYLTVRDWAWWQLPPLARVYVAAVILAAVVIIAVAAAGTEWRQADLGKFLLLGACGAVSAASAPRSAYAQAGGTATDFSTAWVLPIAILLPPVYAAVTPAALIAVAYYFVHRGVPHRRVFTAASISLSYVLAAAVFRLFPASVAGPSPGSGSHAFTWALAVVVCDFSYSLAQPLMIVAAVKMSDPSLRLWPPKLNRDALLGLFVEIDVAVLVTVLVGLSPKLVVLALPTVLLVRRFLIHPFLVEQSRADPKTGLLNVSAWKAEAEAELSRAARGGHPVALVLIDIDHFKLVNDTHGHLAGDRVLGAVAEALTGQSRGYDRAGRFGGEEFVVLLAQTGEQDACKIAERLRNYIADLQIPGGDQPEAPALRVTVSAGVTALEAGDVCGLADLLAAADSAMYAAKQAGRNRVAFASPAPDRGANPTLDTAHSLTVQPRPVPSPDS